MHGSLLNCSGSLGGGVMSRYIINGRRFNCCKESAFEVAEMYKVDVIEIVDSKMQWVFTKNNKWELLIPLFGVV